MSLATVEERSKRNEDDIKQLYEYREKDKSIMIEAINNVQKEMTKIIIRSLVTLCGLVLTISGTTIGVIWANLPNIIK